MRQARCLLLPVSLACAVQAAEHRAADVCVYAATPAGILAAVAVRRAGHSVVVVEPSRWVGGILGAGLKPTQDCPNINAVGGLSRILLTSLGQPADGPRLAQPDLPPAAIEQDFRKLLAEHDILVVFEHRLNRCVREGNRITAAVFDRAPYDEMGCPPAVPVERNSLSVAASIFIDASYEGDLLPAAGVRYQVGRESEAAYQEDGAGVREAVQVAAIDPFVRPGDPASGLLPQVEDDHGLPIGSADPYTQAYNYRIYLTSEPAHRLPLTPPDGYDPAQFELVGRYVAWLAATIAEPDELTARLRRIFPGVSHSGVYNFERHTLFTMAPVGLSHRYADGDWATRARIWKQHQDYFRGLHAFLSADPRVPEPFRAETAALGLDGRHHRETGGWPHQLYVRVTRRMIGRAVITAHDVHNRTVVEDSIGLAQYGIDTYPARRIWFRRDGQTFVGLEGWMFLGGSRGPTGVPYPIPYRAITPREAECANLLVPVCFSASHLGYASARMEPVFMVCGESAGLAAVRALEEQSSAQAIDPARLRQALLEAGQKLIWEIPTDPLERHAQLIWEIPTDPLERHAQWIADLLAEADADGSGTISKAEWDRAKSGWEWLFEPLDADGDGMLTMIEYAALQDYKAQHPDWQERLRAGR